MKRENVVNAIEWIILDEENTNSYDTALRILSYIEDIGMLPPNCSVTIKDGKHTPTERKWEDETK